MMSAWDTAGYFFSGSAAAAVGAGGGAAAGLDAAGNLLGMRSSLFFRLMRALGL